MARHVKFPVVAVAARPRLEVGCSLYIASTHIAPWTVIDLLVDGVEMPALVIDHSPYALRLCLDDASYSLRPWEPGDDRVPHCNGDSLRWTIVEVSGRGALAAQSHVPGALARPVEAGHLAAG